jgi:rRNA maturation RNase YbeY
MAIRFHYEDVTFRLVQARDVRSWIGKIIAHHGQTAGELNYIFCSDEYLLEINRQHLSHDFYTDIITFDYCDGSTISGDLFISIDRVRDNAKGLKISTIDEIHRVMIHGVLHLIGFGDKTAKEIKEIRKQEDSSLTLRSFV